MIKKALNPSSQKEEKIIKQPLFKMFMNNNKRKLHLVKNNKSNYKDSSKSNLEPFLKFLTNDSVNAKNLNKLTFNYDRKLNKDEYVCLLENINAFLVNFLKENNIE